jgi:predicted ATPase with chaperone activity
VSAALNNSGFTLPSRRVTVNLSPDNEAKEWTPPAGEIAPQKT